MFIILLLCLCIATQNYEVNGWMPNLSKNEDLELEKQLKVINKSPIKIIQTENGRIVDCIDINKQLAFDNPLLKNHKIQLKSNFEDTQTKVQADDTFKYSNIGLENELCPEGTIPVQRTTKEDLIRANRVSNPFASILTKDDRGSHFAGLRINFPSVYFGIQGTLSVHNPPVDVGQMSSAYIWLTNETNVGNANTIHAGWQASPDITGDTLTHFFISWNNNVQHTGCTNMLCPGFVQTSSRIYLGSPILNVSVYGGPIFSMSLSLTQDKATNNWWLRAQNEDVGYFPAEIFSNNFLYASKGGWTGHTKFFTNAPAPQMGSGHFPDRNPLHSGYISRIYFKDRYRQDFGPLRSNVISYADNIRCYDVKYYDYVDDILQRVLMYGGPGGNCGN